MSNNFKKGYPHTAQKCLSGNFEGGTLAEVYEGSPASASCCYQKIQTSQQTLKNSNNDITTNILTL